VLVDAAPRRNSPDVPTSTTESDAFLLERCRAGDEVAWRSLVDRYRALVYSTALEVGLERDDAGDVFQDVWLDLYRSLPRIRDGAALPRWLVVATRRLSYKRAAAGRRLRSEVSVDLVDPAQIAIELMEGLETRDRVERALADLGGRCAELLRLLFLSPSRVPYAEIGRRLDIAVGSIGPTRARCLTRLRKILGVN
jgi:RNA polymerase sigma factor (sigma-70 family)